MDDLLKAALYYGLGIRENIYRLEQFGEIVFSKFGKISFDSVAPLEEHDAPTPPPEEHDAPTPPTQEEKESDDSQEDKSSQQDTKQENQIFVLTPTGKYITININLDAKVEDLQLLIEKHEGTPIYEQRLIYASKQLENGHTLQEYNIQKDSTIHLVLRLNGGEDFVDFEHFSINPDLLDPGYNFDFRGIDDSNSQFYRGGKPYKRPVGCYRYALNVNGKYGDDTWLGSSNQPGEWAVAYHGTEDIYVNKILTSELKPGNNNWYGVGVYCTPNINTALGYAESFQYQGKFYKVVLQTRVNPDKIYECKLQKGPDDYWVALQKDIQKSSTEIIRPYGICIF